MYSLYNIYQYLYLIKYVERSMKLMHVIRLGIREKLNAYVEQIHLFIKRPIFSKVLPVH